MKDIPRTLAIIPARGGSKGIPNKNILKFGNKPLIHYTINCALESKLISKIIVSSDSKEILDCCSHFNGIELNERPLHLASDNSNIVETFIHLIDEEENKGEDFDYVILLQPTSPIRLKGEIDEVISALINSSSYNSLISVVEMNDIHPSRMYSIEANELKALNEKEQSLRRQDLPKVYLRDGCYYVSSVNSLKLNKSLFANPQLPFVRNGDLLLNIDGKRDILVAETLINNFIEDENP